MGADYSVIREHIAHVVPGFAAYEERASASPAGSPCRARRTTRDLRAPTPGKAHFTVNPVTAVEVPPGHLLLQTIRSHDQFNTTVYGLDDRYRGINGGRRVVFVAPRTWPSSASPTATWSTW